MPANQSIMMATTKPLVQLIKEQLAEATVDGSTAVVTFRRK